jgi:hypothetical protein
MKKVVMMLLFLFVSLVAQEQKVVFALTTGKVDNVKKRLISQVILLDTYYKKHGDTLRVAVVIYGNGYKFFLKNPEKTIYAKDKALLKEHKTLQKDLKNLHDNYNVAFDICNMGMKKRNITKEMLYPFVHPAYNKNIALIKWQNKGYAYIEIE